jgi:hypothetical protein
MKYNGKDCTVNVPLLTIDHLPPVWTRGGAMFSGWIRGWMWRRRARRGIQKSKFKRQKLLTGCGLLLPAKSFLLSWLLYTEELLWAAINTDVFVINAASVSCYLVRHSIFTRRQVLCRTFFFFICVNKSDWQQNKWERRHTVIQMRRCFRRCLRSSRLAWSLWGLSGVFSCTEGIIKIKDRRVKQLTKVLKRYIRKYSIRKS